jgi:hypothetical protein
MSSLPTPCLRTTPNEPAQTSVAPGRVAQTCRFAPTAGGCPGESRQERPLPQPADPEPSADATAKDWTRGHHNVPRMSRRDPSIR